MDILYHEDIVLKPSQDIALNFLMSKVMSALHLIFVESEKENGVIKLGLGFPMYNKEKLELGNLLRLYAEEPIFLKKATEDVRLKRLDDYLSIGEIKQQPSSIYGYKQYRRIQIKESKDRLIRRYAKRHNIDLEQAKKKYDSFKSSVNLLPFVMMESLSSKQRFRLYIEEVKQEKYMGPPLFNSYGLTKSGSLPIF